MMTPRQHYEFLLGYYEWRAGCIAFGHLEKIGLNFMQRHLHSLVGTGLGDVWTSVAYALRQAPKDDSTVYVNGFYYNEDRRELARECATLLDGGKRVEVVDAGGGYVANIIRDAYAAPVWPVRRGLRHYWQGEIHGGYAPLDYGKTRPATVCYQLVGVAQAEEKNCRPEDVQTLVRKLNDAGFLPVELGKPETLTQCVHELATCEAFFGIDSGYTHVNYSVGAPAFLTRNGIGADAFARHDAKNGLWFESLRQAAQAAL